jgi:hypothetical protein
MAHMGLLAFKWSRRLIHYNTPTHPAKLQSLDIRIYSKHGRASWVVPEARSVIHDLELHGVSQKNPLFWILVTDIVQNSSILSSIRLLHRCFDAEACHLRFRKFLNLKKQKIPDRFGIWVPEWYLGEFESESKSEKRLKRCELGVTVTVTVTRGLIVRLWWIRLCLYASGFFVIQWVKNPQTHRTEPSEGKHHCIRESKRCVLCFGK